MDTILTYLQTCVKEETQVLLDAELQAQGRKRKSKKLEAQCAREAQDHYVEEICEMVEDGISPLNHWSVISYRRKPKVWAIAGAIRHRIQEENDV